MLLLYYVLLQRLAMFFLEHLSLAVFLDASGDVVLYLFVLGSIERDEILTRDFALILLLLVVLGRRRVVAVSLDIRMGAYLFEVVVGSY